MSGLLFSDLNRYNLYTDMADEVEKLESPSLNWKDTKAKSALWAGEPAHTNFKQRDAILENSRNAVKQFVATSEYAPNDAYGQAQMAYVIASMNPGMDIKNALKIAQGGLLQKELNLQYERKGGVGAAFDTFRNGYWNARAGEAFSLYMMDPNNTDALALAEKYFDKALSFKTAQTGYNWFTDNVLMPYARVSGNSAPGSVGATAIMIGGKVLSAATGYGWIFNLAKAGASLYSGVRAGMSQAGMDFYAMYREADANGQKLDMTDPFVRTMFLTDAMVMGVVEVGDFFWSPTYRALSNILTPTALSNAFAKSFWQGLRFTGGQFVFSDFSESAEEFVQGIAGDAIRNAVYNWSNTHNNTVFPIKDWEDIIIDATDAFTQTTLEMIPTVALKMALTLGIGGVRAKTAAKNQTFSFDPKKKQGVLKSNFIVGANELKAEAEKEAEKEAVSEEKKEGKEGKLPQIKIVQTDKGAVPATTEDKENLKELFRRNAGKGNFDIIIEGMEIEDLPADSRASTLNSLSVFLNRNDEGQPVELVTGYSTDDAAIVVKDDDAKAKVKDKLAVFAGTSEAGDDYVVTPTADGTSKRIQILTQDQAEIKGIKTLQPNDWSFIQMNKQAASRLSQQEYLQQEEVNEAFETIVANITGKTADEIRNLLDTDPDAISMMLPEGTTWENLSASANFMPILSQITGRSTTDLLSSGDITFNATGETEYVDRNTYQVLNFEKQTGKVYRVDEATGQRVEYDANDRQNVARAAANVTPQTSEDGKKKFNITINKDAKADDIMHELMHVARAMASKERLSGFVQAYGATDLWTDDIRRNGDGSYTFNDVTYDNYSDAYNAARENEERFVKDFMNYLSTGAAPNVQIESFFEKLKRFIKEIVQRFSDMLSQETVAAFDRLLGGELTVEPSQTIDEAVEASDATLTDAYDYTEEQEDNGLDEEGNPLYSLTPEAQRQYDEVVARYKGTDQWLKAPNGENTNLTERQWVMVRTQNFLNWFGDWINDPKSSSKVVDENGEPMVVYHGTGADFDVFDTTMGRNSMDILGSFFSPWDLDAKGYGPNVRAFFINIKNPANFAKGFAELSKYKGKMYAGRSARENLIAAGYDGVNNDNEEFIVFNSNQIKSATDNNGEFSNRDNSILYSLATDKQWQTMDANTQRRIDADYERTYNEYHGTDKWMKAPNGQPTNLTERQWVQVRTPAFKEWFGDWENDPENASKIVDENGEPRIVFRGDMYMQKNDNVSGLFVSMNRAFASGYGPVYELFINARNPFYGYRDVESLRQFVSDNFLEIQDEMNETFLDNYYDDEDEGSSAFKTIDEIMGSLRDGWWTVYEDSEIITDEIRRRGYDAIYIFEESDNLWLASPNQIKSATDNSGAFSTQDDSILFSLAPAVDSQEFHDWFDGSKVVDAQGNPLVVYHGSPVIGIDEFNPSGAINGGEGLIYATRDRNVATEYSQRYNQLSAFTRVPTGEFGEVYPVYMSLKNPLDLKNLTEHDKQVLLDAYKQTWKAKDAEKTFNEVLEAKNYEYLKAMADRVIRNLSEYGYDGLITPTEYAAVRPEQVKMVNHWTYDTDEESETLYSLSPEREAAAIKARKNDIQYAVDAGIFVRTEYLKEFQGEEWADAELELRDYMKDHPELIEKAKRAKNLEDFKNDVLGKGKKKEQKREEESEYDDIPFDETDILETEESEDAYPEDWDDFFEEPVPEEARAEDERLTDNWLERIYDYSNAKSTEDRDRQFANEWTSSEDKTLELGAALANYKDAFWKSRPNSKQGGRWYAKNVWGAFTGVSTKLLRLSDGTGRRGVSRGRSTSSQIQEVQDLIRKNPKPYREAYNAVQQAESRAADARAGLGTIGMESDYLRLQEIDDDIAKEIAKIEADERAKRLGVDYKTRAQDLRKKLRDAEKDLEKAKEKANTQISDLRSRLRLSEQREDDLKTQLKEAEKDLASAEKEYGKLIEKMGGRIEEYQEKAKNTKELERNLNDRRARVEELRGQLTEANKEVRRLTSAVNAKTRQLEAQKATSYRNKRIRQILRLTNFNNSTIDASFEDSLLWIRNLFDRNEDDIDNRRNLTERIKELKAEMRAAEDRQEDTTAMSQKLLELQKMKKQSRWVTPPAQLAQYYPQLTVRSDNRPSMWSAEELDNLLSALKLMRSEGKQMLEAKQNARRNMRLTTSYDYFREVVGRAAQLNDEDQMSSGALRNDVVTSLKEAKDASLILRYGYRNAKLQRLARILDGDQEGVLYDWFVRKNYQLQSQELEGQMKRYDAAQKVWKELGIKADDLAKEGFQGTKQNGTEYSLSRGEMLGIYIYAQSELGMEKLTHLYGNEIKGDDIQKIIDDLTPQETAWADFMLGDFAENYPRLRETYYRGWNMNLGERENYFTLIPADSVSQEKLEATGMDPQADIVGKDGKAYTNKSFTKAVNPNAIYPLDLDVTKSWYRQVAKQEHFIAYGEWAVDTQYLFDEKGGNILNTMSRKFDRTKADAFKKIVNSVIGAQTTDNDFDRAWTKFLANRNSSVLIANTGPIIKQAPSWFAAFNGDIDPAKLVVNSMGLTNPLMEFLSKHPDIAAMFPDVEKATDFIYANAPEMKNRQIDIDMAEALSRMENGKIAGTMSKARNKVFKATAGAVDKLVVNNLWMSRYYTVFDQQTASGKTDIEAHKEAAFKASQFISETQPTAMKMDQSAMQIDAKTSSFLRAIMVFTNQVFNTFNQMFFDIPMAFRRGEYKKFAGKIISTMFMLGTVGILSGKFIKREGEDDDKYKGRLWREILGTAVQAASPGFGSIVATAIERGDDFSTYIFGLDTLGKAIRTAVTPSERKTTAERWADVLLDLGTEAGYAIGVPVTPVKNVVKTVKEKNPGYMLNSAWGQIIESHR